METSEHEAIKPEISELNDAERVALTTSKLQKAISMIAKLATSTLEDFEGIDDMRREEALFNKLLTEITTHARNTVGMFSPEELLLIDGLTDKTFHDPTSQIAYLLEVYLSLRAKFSDFRKEYDKAQDSNKKKMFLIEFKTALEDCIDDYSIDALLKAGEIAAAFHWTYMHLDLERQPDELRQLLKIVTNFMQYLLDLTLSTNHGNSKITIQSLIDLIEEAFPMAPSN